MIASSSKNKLQAWVLIAAFVIVLIAVESVAMHRVYAARVQGTADFFARWYGAKELVLRGRNPYDRQIDLEAQEILFGRQTRPDEDQVNFAYPLYVVYFFWPLTLVPYSWAQAIWMVVLQFCLLGSTILLFDLLRWRPRTGLFIATLLWSLYFYPGTRAIMLGQFSVIVFLCMTVTFWSMMKGHDRLAGAFLALTTIKPQMVFLIIPLILLWCLRRKRWSFIVAFGISSLLLLLSSMLWVPDWPLRFLNNITAYSDYVGFGSPLENMTAQFAPGFDQILNPLVIVVLGGFMLWLWWGVLFKDPEDFIWAANWTLLIGNLIAFRSATANHVVLYLAMMLIFKRWLGARFEWRILAIQIISSVFLWMLFLNTIDTTRGENFEAIFMHGLMPTILIIYYCLDWRALKLVTPKLSVIAHQS